MKRDVYKEFSFNEDIEIMNLDYMMKNMQNKPLNEDYEQSIKTDKRNIWKEIL